MRAAVNELDHQLPAELPLLCQCADTNLAEVASWVDHPQRLVGFDGLFLAPGTVATLVSGPELDPQIRRTVEGFFLALRRQPIWIEDAPALILPRLGSCLVN